jgi:sortase (surface protein transpeptidase)
MLLILALVVLALSPLVGQVGAAAAQDDGDGGQAEETQEAEQPEEPVQPTEEVPEVTEEVQETEPVEETEEATEEAAETPENELLGAIEVEYRECPVDYDIANADPDTVLMDCAQVNDVGFQVTTSDGTTQSQLTGEFGDSHVSFTELPTGSTTVTQTTPYVETYVSCNGIVQHGGPETGVMSLPVSNGSVQWDLQDDEIVFCTWFVTGAADPLEDAEAPGTPENELVGSINVNYRECPPAYDLATADPTALDTDCIESPNGVPFQVSNAGGVIETQNTGDINDGVVAFANVPTGAITITQVTAASVPRVFCEGVVSNGGPETGLMELGATTGSVDWNLLDDEVVYCDWYTIPAGDEPSDLTIYKWLCPEAYDYTAPGADPKADCTTPQDGVNFTLDHPVDGETDLQTMTGDSLAGAVRFGGTAPGTYTIIETPPADISFAFLWGCEISSPEEEPVILFQAAPISEGYEYQILIPSGVEITCNWFNIPDGDGNTVTVYKWICPEGTVYDQEYAWYETNCTQHSDDFSFTLTTTAGTTSTTPNTGQYQWTDVPMGPIGIQETIPPEYGSPVVSCGASTNEGGTPSEYERVDAPTGYVAHEIPDPSGYNFYCQWFNIPGGPGEVTIYKWTCAEGYDLYASGADPLNDCTEATNGVTFFLDQPDPADTDLQTDTGDSIQGAVYFGGLKPGTYTVTEEVPADSDYVFVLDCTGGVQGKVHPYPLSMGDTLAIDVHAGDKIVCHWFNVPGYDPDYGRMTVEKYVCSTPSYVSEVDCEIYEDGATFDLVVWNGSDWVDVDTKTTDGAGKITWINLEPGRYWLDEHDHQWCAISSAQLDADEEYLQVSENQETVVKVYNCQIDSSTKGKQPTKYPNTGVGPSPDGSAPATLPSFAGFLGLVMLALTRIRNLLPAAGERPGGQPRVTPTSPRRRPSRQGIGVLVLPLIALLVLVPATAATAQDGGGETDNDEADPGTPQSALCLPGTPKASARDDQHQAADVAEEAEATETPVILRADNVSSHNADAGEDDCLRGPVPVQLAIEAIEVDAEVEVLETVGGVMQAPSGAEDVAWYKETARLGEPGNIVIAGHLNYWGVPEGVFFALGTLEQDDLIEITGEDGETYRYAVEWVHQEDATQPPREDVLGPTEEESLTLITCGGEWDPSITEYDERTVVRAVRVTDVEGTPGA